MLKKIPFILLLAYFPLSELIAQNQSYSEAQTKMLREADEGLKLAVIKKDTPKIAEAYYIHGKIEVSRHNFLEAQKWLLKSLSLIEKRGDSYELGRLYIRLEENEIWQLHYQNAIKYLRIALKIFKNIESDRGLALAYAAFGNMYSDENAPKPIYNLDSALFYYSKIEPHYKKINDQLGIAGVNATFGNFFAKKNDIKSIEYYTKALKYFSDNNRYPEKLQVLLAMASTYLKFKKYGDAYQKILEAEQLNSQVNNYQSKRKLEITYLEYYKAIGDWKHALKHQEVVHQLEKEDLLADHKGAVSELNIAYNTQKREAQLGEKDNIIVKQNQFLVGILIMLLGVSGLSFLYYILYKKNKKISLKNEVLLKEQNHRIKNNLQSISSLLNLQSNRMVDSDAKYAVEESKLRVEVVSNLHQKLYKGEELAEVELSEFIIEIVEGVLQTFGFNDLNPKYQLERMLLAADQTLSIGLIINELVTNSCKYAFKDNQSPALTIKGFVENDDYIIEVADNGEKEKDFSVLNVTTEIQKSFGMRLIQMQVIQLQGTYRFYFNSGTNFIMRFTPILCNF
ncbi:tetratricopeptide repeat-containing sensor histidine kinase [Emticicia aquatilis]|uniref:tetratricopeptide repeat-containing sensor histidine kinase n=1 Tax=Emticicia aquatilis TaxID=1537369 RepID=UPI00166ED881|nr:sensor histidine kinase [Emticicia aquatilis]